MLSEEELQTLTETLTGLQDGEGDPLQVKKVENLSGDFKLRFAAGLSLFLVLQKYESVLTTISIH